MLYDRISRISRNIFHSNSAAHGGIVIDVVGSRRSDTDEFE